MIPGTRQHGEQFIPDALAHGARALLVDYPLARFPVHQVVVSDVRKAYARLTQALSGYPTRHMGVVGVTGTNGKTTTTWLVRSILEHAEKRCGLLGTIEYDDGAKCRASKLTTPEPSVSARWLNRMLEQQTRHFAMELSSHALSQSRCEGVDLDAGVITNITHDHLDYHRDFESYKLAKSGILSLIKPGGVAVINNDDITASQLAAMVPSHVQLKTIGIDQPADITATILAMDGGSTTFRVHAGTQVVEMRTTLVGKHNVSNCLGAIASCLHLGLSLEECRQGIGALTHVPGRLQQVNPGGTFAVYVDYAHTPDAVFRVVDAIKQMTAGRVICVLGAGGDRDRTKRPQMARAAMAADQVVFTSDNPRSEDPLEIIQDMLTGVECPSSVHVEPDRRSAIDWAIQIAGPGDAVIVAGKGHEAVQIVGDRRLPFDDVAVCRESLGLATLEPMNVRRGSQSLNGRTQGETSNSGSVNGPHFDSVVQECQSSTTPRSIHSGPSS